MTKLEKRRTAKKYNWQLMIMWEGINRYTLKCKGVPEALHEASKLFDLGKGLEAITIRRIIN